VGSWGFDKEMVEVGCLLGNLINKDNFVEEVEEFYTLYVFEWVEELLMVKEEQEMTESLYFALGRTVGGLQRRYQLGQCELPQLFQGQVINLIEITLFKNCFSSSSSAVGMGERVCAFIQQMIPVILVLCPYAWCEKLISNIFTQLGTLKKTLFRSLCSMLNRLITFSGIDFGEQLDRAVHSRNRIRALIVEQYHNKIIIYLTVMEVQMKEQIFEMIVRLIGCDSTDAAFYLERFLDLGLETWMIKNFSVSNQELNILFFQLVAIAEDLRMRDCLARFLAHTERERGRQERNPFRPE
jgi:hypothetical protein